MSDEPRNPSLVDLLLKTRRTMVDGMTVSLPAVVTRYDSDKQCVDAQPVIMQERAGEDGVVIEERLPAVLNAPVTFYGSGPWRDTLPITEGSVVILHFSSAALDRWLTLGGEVAPRDPRKHTLTDAFAYPGGHSFGGATAPSTSAPTNARVFHGPADGNFLIGGPDSNRPPATLDDLEALKAIFDAWVVAPMDGGAALKMLLADWNPTGSPRIKLP